MVKQFRIGQISELAQHWKINYCKNYGNDRYNNITSSQNNDLKSHITNYKAYTEEQKDMARKTFKCTTMEYYSNTGRVKYMEFTET